MIIGEIIKRVAKQRGHTAESLAEQMKLSRRAVYDLFNKDNIGSKTLSQLCEILDYDFGYHIRQEKEISAELLHQPKGTYSLVPPKKKAPIRISIEIDPDINDFDKVPDLMKKLNQAVKEMQKDQE